MAYITSNEVAEKRKKIKGLFPAKNGWKFSITRNKTSRIVCNVLKSPYDIRKFYLPGPKYQFTGIDTITDETNVSVSLFNIDKKYYGPARRDLSAIASLLDEGNYDKSDVMNDYFDVGFYVNLELGHYDKPYCPGDKWADVLPCDMPQIPSDEMDAAVALLDTMPLTDKVIQAYRSIYAETIKKNTRAD